METNESYSDCQTSSAPEICCSQSNNSTPLEVYQHPPVCSETIYPSQSGGYLPIPHRSGYQPVLVYVPEPVQRSEYPPPYESGEHRPQSNHQSGRPPQLRNTPEESCVSIDSGWSYQSHKGNSQSRELVSAADNCGEINVPRRPYQFAINCIGSVTIVIIIFLALLCGVVVATKFWHSKGSDTVIRDFDHGEFNSKRLRLISRNEWLAQPPSDRIETLNLPVHRVTITQTATDSCTNQAACTHRARIIQDFHMNALHFPDIAYNFLVSGDGSVFEGRGWDQKGFCTKVNKRNVDSIYIAFIGTFSNEAPPEEQLNAAKLLIEESIRLKKIVPNYRLYGTEGPGSALCRKLKNWPNWSSETDAAGRAAL